MNVSKSLLIAFSSLILATAAFGQAKDESFAASPVKSVQVFPNPTTEFLSVKFETPIAKKSVIKIHNIIGNEITVDGEIIDEYEVRFRVKDLHEGYYILAVQNSQTGAKATYKFLKL